MLTCGVLSSAPIPSRSADLETPAPLPPPRLTQVTSASGRFAVLGSDNRENLLLADWLEQTTTRVEQIMGRKIPLGERRSILLTVHRIGESEKPRIDAVREAQGSRIVRRLTVFTRDDVVTEDVQGTLCLMLLDRCVWDLASTNAPGQVARSTPYWLSEGVSQNLSADLKARNCWSVYDAWTRGKAMPLARFLDAAERSPDPWVQEGGSGVTNAAEAAGTTPTNAPAWGEPARAGGAPASREDMIRRMSGVFVGWLMSLPDSPGRLDKILRRLAGGDPVSPELLASVVPGCLAPADLDREWDRWMLREKRVIHTPGVLTAHSLEQFRSALLLSAGDSGIPMTGELNAVVTWRELIRQREASWIPLFAHNKAAILRLTAIGRGKEIGETAERYGDFLDALGKRKSEDKLVRLLEKAENALTEAEKAVEKMPSP